MSITDRIEVIARYPGEPAWVCVRCKGTDIKSILWAERAHTADGATLVTVRVGGSIEYAVAHWLAYIEGDLQHLTPVEVAA